MCMFVDITTTGTKKQRFDTSNIQQPPLQKSAQQYNVILKSAELSMYILSICKGLEYCFINFLL